MACSVGPDVSATAPGSARSDAIGSADTDPVDFTATAPRPSELVSVTKPGTFSPSTNSYQVCILFSVLSFNFKVVLFTARRGGWKTLVLKLRIIAKEWTVQQEKNRIRRVCTDDWTVQPKVWCSYIFTVFIHEFNRRAYKT